MKFIYKAWSYFKSLFQTATQVTTAPYAVAIEKKKYSYSYPGYPKLSKQLTYEDRTTIASNHKVKAAYINMILAGTRSDKSAKAKAIIRDLEILANINEVAEMEKEGVLKAA